MIKYESDPWNRDGDYDAVVMSEKCSFVRVGYILGRIYSESDIF